MRGSAGDTVTHRVRAGVKARVRRDRMARQRCGMRRAWKAGPRRNGSVGTGSATPSCRLFSCSQSCSPSRPSSRRRRSPWRTAAVAPVARGRRARPRPRHQWLRALCHRPGWFAATSTRTRRVRARRACAVSTGGRASWRRRSASRAWRAAGAGRARWRRTRSPTDGRNTRSARERVGGVRSHDDSPGPVSAAPPVRSAQRCGARRPAFECPAARPLSPRGARSLSLGTRPAGRRAERTVSACRSIYRGRAVDQRGGGGTAPDSQTSPPRMASSSSIKFVLTHKPPTSWRAIGRVATRAWGSSTSTMTALDQSERQRSIRRSPQLTAETCRGSRSSRAPGSPRTPQRALRGIGQRRWSSSTSTHCGAMRLRLIPAARVPVLAWLRISLSPVGRLPGLVW